MRGGAGLGPRGPRPSEQPFSRWGLSGMERGRAWTPHSRDRGEFHSLISYLVGWDEGSKSWVRGSYCYFKIVEYDIIYLHLYCN